MGHKVDSVRRGSIDPPRGKTIHKCLPSAQICRPKSLQYSGQLRGTASILYVQFGSRLLQTFQQTEVNEQAIELLAPRIKMLSESLCAPIPTGDFSEEDRESELKR